MVIVKQIWTNNIDLEIYRKVRKERFCLIFANKLTSSMKLLPWLEKNGIKALKMVTKPKSLYFQKAKNCCLLSNSLLKNCKDSNGIFYQNCSDLLWKKLLYVVFDKNFWSSRLKAENFQSFEITRTIYWNSERSEQFLVTECILNLFLDFGGFSYLMK